MAVDEKRWYVVRAASGYEVFVMRILKERVARDPSLSAKIGDVMVPTEEVLEMRGGKKCKTSRRFFPGYVLVHMVMDDQTWYLIKGIPRVLGFIGGTGEKPAPISDSEAADIILQVEEGVAKPKPKVLFESGEIIRVTQGPFDGFTGIVSEVNYDKSRLRVEVLIFGRSTPVELDFSQVEKS